MFSKKVAFFMLGILLSATVFAADTDEDLQLDIELVQDSVRFVVKNSYIEYLLPRKLYKKAALQAFIERREFIDAQLKEEFSDMLNGMLYSEFDAAVFLPELIKMLHEFDALPT